MAKRDDGEANHYRKSAEKGGCWSVAQSVTQTEFDVI